MVNSRLGFGATIWKFSVDEGDYAAGKVVGVLHDSHGLLIDAVIPSKNRLWSHG